MLNFTREKVRVDVAPGTQSIVIGVGEETRAIALEIINEGETPLASLKLKYGHGSGYENNNQWWNALVKESDFTTPSTLLRKWIGPNPYTLPKGGKSVLYLDTTEIDALLIEAEALGDKTQYPEPYTAITVNAYHIKLAHYGAAMVSTETGQAQAPAGGTQEPKTLTSTGKGTTPTSASSFTVSNIGEAPGTLGGVALAPGESNSWSAGSGKTLKTMAFDATGTTFKITYIVDSPPAS